MQVSYAQRPRAQPALGRASDVAVRCQRWCLGQQERRKELAEQCVVSSWCLGQRARCGETAGKRNASGLCFGRRGWSKAPEVRFLSSLMSTLAHHKVKLLYKRSIKDPARGNQ